MAKIENVQFILPVPGQSYTDIRPTISGEDWDDIRTTASELAYGVGNKKMGDLLSQTEKSLTEPLTSSHEVLGDGVLFNKEAHTYSKDGKEYISGSVFAHMFEKDFPRDMLAKKVAEKNGRTVEDVLEGWNSKGDISLMYGTLIHKCLETYIKYGELPNNEYLKEIVMDWANVSSYKGELESEKFVQDDDTRTCGVIDLLVKEGDKYILADFKTGDIYKKTKFPFHLEWTQDRFTSYTLQLNFYRRILERQRIKVSKMVVWWLKGDGWEKVDVPVIKDIDKLIGEVWNPTK